MKFIFSIILVLLSFGSVFAAESAETGTYEFYTQSVNNFCKPTTSNLWTDWKKGSLIQIDQVGYADIDKKEDGDRKYKEFLIKIKADPSQIDSLGLNIGPTFLKKASYVYKETMGAIYACAVMNAKIRIIDNLMKIPMTQSNIKDRYQRQLAAIRNSTKEKCRTIGDTSELSVKKTLLDNTTYQYCNYRQYLSYLDSASKKSLAAYYSGATSSSLSNTDSAAREIAQSAGKITAEIIHVKEVFPQAMVAFTEFEKTYASHVILEFILQDYIDLRDSLKKLLNPIGQVIYKASNKQKQ